MDSSHPAPREQQQSSPRTNFASTPQLPRLLDAFLQFACPGWLKGVLRVGYITSVASNTENGANTPSKTKCWNLKIHPLWKGDSPSRTSFLGSSLLVFWGVVIFTYCNILIEESFLTVIFKALWGSRVEDEMLWSIKITLEPNYNDLTIPNTRCMVDVPTFTSSTAQGGGGSFKNRKRIGEIDCCEWRMSKQKHWPTD